MTAPSFDLYAVAVLVYLILVIPVVGVWENRRLVRWTAAGRADARLVTYRWIMVLEWVSMLAMLVWWLALGRGAAPLLLTFDVDGWRWLPVGLALGLSAAQIWQTRVALGRPEELAKIDAKIGDMRVLAPRDARELRTFDVLAVTAGICEEIMYRGVLLAILAAEFGYWPAFVISSVVFGLGHLYQGSAGVLKTGLVGAVMGLLTIFSGTLVPAMILHAVIDLTAGRALAAAVGRPATRVAEGGPEADSAQDGTGD